MVTKKNKPWLGAWHFQFHPVFSREGRGTGIWVSNWSYLQGESSITTSKIWGSESFQVEHIYLSGGRWTPATWEQKLPCSGPFFTYLFTWLFICPLYCILYDTSVNISNCFPEFCEPFSRIIEPNKGIMGTLNYSQLIRSTSHNFGPAILAFAIGAVFWDRALKLWNMILTTHR